jgi:hypothetical protein
VRPQRRDHTLLGEQRREDPARQIAEPFQGAVRLVDQPVELVRALDGRQLPADVEQLALGSLVDVAL